MRRGKWKNEDVTYVESRELYNTCKNMLSWCNNRAASCYVSRASANQNPVFPCIWASWLSTLVSPLFFQPRVHYSTCRARCWFLNLVVCSFTSMFFLAFHGATAPNVPGPPHYRRFTITLRHTTLGRNPPDEGSARSRDLYLTTHNTQETDIHAFGRIRIRNHSKRAAADLRLRLRGHWDRHIHVS